MVDWFSGQVAADASGLSLNRVMEVDRRGNIVNEFEKWLPVEGSHRSTVLVKRNNPQSDLECTPGCPAIVYQVSGNPSKFLQGHNAFGPSVTCLESVVFDMMGALPSDVRPVGVRPGLHKSRVDITVMVEMGSHERVHEWLVHAGARTRSRHGRPMVSGSTVYWGKHSRRWAIKCYCKACELKAHPVADLSLSRVLGQYVSSQLRVELTLRGQELRKHTVLDESLVWEYFNRLDVGVLRCQEALSGGDLPNSSRNVFRSWLAGYSIRQELSRTRFYAHRRRILDSVGLDISLSPVGALDGYPREELDVSSLRSREVVEVPDYLRDYLWVPQRGLILGVHSS